jgi:hypothetical protein
MSLTLPFVSEQNYQLRKPYEISFMYVCFLLNGMNPDDDQTIYESISMSPSELFIANKNLFEWTINGTKLSNKICVEKSISIRHK